MLKLYLCTVIRDDILLVQSVDEDVNTFINVVISFMKLCFPNKKIMYKGKLNEVLWFIKDLKFIRDHYQFLKDINLC